VDGPGEDRTCSGAGPRGATPAQWLHGRYAQWHNKRHRYSGHLFQGRCGAVRVTSDAELWMAAAYIARNPVAANLCKRPEEWMWSSYAATLGLTRSPPWLHAERLLEYFAATGGNARALVAALATASAAVASATPRQVNAPAAACRRSRVSP
jgi:putative transposase